MRLGRLAAAAEAFRQALVDDPIGQALAIQHLVAAEVSIATGSFEEAAAHLEASRFPGDTDEGELGRGYLATARARLALAQRRFGDVRRIVDATTPRLATMDHCTEMRETTWWLVEVGLAAVAEQAEAARAAGDDDALVDVRAEADSLCKYLDLVRQQRDADGIEDLGLNHGYELLIAGHLARIEDCDDPALWVSAADAFPPSSVEALTARYRQAEAMLASRAPRDEIRAVMADANAAAVEIGAAPLASQFAALSRRARIDLRPAAPTAPPDDAGPIPDDAPGPGTVALRGRGLSDR